MASQTAKRVLVVAGLGNGAGTGGATARLFAKKGYAVALIARGSAVVDKLSEEINREGGQAASFPIASYSNEDVTAAWASIQQHFPKPKYAIRAAVFNAGPVFTAGAPVFKPFLSVTPSDVQETLQTGIAGAFAFSRAAILAFKGNDLEEEEPAGKRGTLIFTGATASLRGGPVTSIFSAGKFSLRALSQSLAKEFGKENIHVAHVVIDGAILTERLRDSHKSWEKNEDARLSPESIASTYLFLVNQDRSAWGWEIDLRPAHEKW